MPRRHIEQLSDEPPKKKSFITSLNGNVDIKQGENLSDITGKTWKLGKPVGVGGFGVIYLVSEERNKVNDDKYVVKIESHGSGPLFVEINCYLRIAKLQMIDEWMMEKNMSSLGMPHYVASGSHIYRGNKYRFLILPRYEKDLQQILQDKKKFNLKTVLLISSQILHVLEYIHSKGYIHSDIKASNIMLNNEIKYKPKTSINHYPIANFEKSPKLGRRYPKVRTCKARTIFRIPKVHNLRKNCNVNYIDDIPYLDEILQIENNRSTKEKSTTRVDQVFLLDFGLASKYRLSNGNHRQCEEDERKAHAGTLLFCSRDAHKGVQSRRSDLESLAYNMVYWLTGTLPWAEDEQPHVVEKKKRHCFADVKGFLCFCFTDPPRILQDIFQYIRKLEIQETPDYELCQKFLAQALQDHGYQNDSCFDFNNIEGWGLVRKKTKRGLENSGTRRKIVYEFKRPPLLSNVPIMPLLRKKIKTKKAAAALNWSKMLDNPEMLLKQARERRVTEGNDSPPTVLNLNIDDLNPTAAMREVFFRHEERKDSFLRVSHSDQVPEGYTPAMALVRQKMIEECALQEAVKTRKTRKVTRRTASKRIKSIKETTQLKTKMKHVPIRRTYSLRG